MRIEPGGGPQLDKSVVLCGFMGCGKTTAGKILATRTGAAFIDMDALIEEREGMCIPEIFKVCGEESFRDREHNAILEVSRMSGVVIATGGGALTYPRNVSALKNGCVIVFLNVEFGDCYSRIKNSDRPLVLSNTRERLEALYNSRAEQYRSTADIELAATGSPDEIACEIMRRLGQNTSEA